jgi:hypothetical protein
MAKTKNHYAKMKPNGDMDISNLCQAIYTARYTLRDFRIQRLAAVQQYVGAHWSSEGSNLEVPINMIALYCDIVGRKLVSQNPRVMLSTWRQQDRPAVNAMQSWSNREIENMTLGKTLGRSVLDGLFSLGITKVALSTPADASVAAWQLEAGQPFAECVDLDDFVFDIHARAFEEVGYIGHRYRVRLDVVRDDPRYSRARKDLSASPDNQFNTEGDLRISVLQRAFWSSQEENADYVDLWEIYDPYRKLVYTLADASVGPEESQYMGKSEPLLVQRWLGPTCGPYHMLGFGVVPGNAMPKAPIQNLYYLHTSINNICRKLIRQAQRQKTVLPIRGLNTEDYDRLASSSDGEPFRYDGDTPPTEVSYGGPDPKNFTLMMALIEQFNLLAGNLETMGGLAPQSKTLGQDKLLNENSSATLASLQETAVGHASSVLKALCWYWWNHPTKVMTTTFHPPGLPEHEIVRTLHPAMHPDPNELKRTARLADMDIKVDPYSLQAQTPQTRVQTIISLVQGVITPMMPIMMQQGIQFDMNEFLMLVSKYYDQPDLPQICKIAAPPTQDSSGGVGGMGGQETPKMPQQTERTYNRVSSGGQNNSTANKGFSLSQMMEGKMGAGEKNGMVGK